MKRIVRIAMLAAATAALGGCLHSEVEEHWGESYDAQVVWQTANPGAPESKEPAEGLDSETAARIADRYYEGQEQQRQRRQVPTVIIGN